jgi:hypothetical protein
MNGKLGRLDRLDRLDRLPIESISIYGSNGE